MPIFAKRLAVITCLSVLSFAGLSSGPSWAGFEWTPPAPKQVQSPPSMPAPAMPQQSYNDMSAGFPAAPVTAEPLGAPTSILPPVMAAQPQMRTQASVTKSSAGGLYIDPYPLRNGQAAAMDVAPASVQQAMAEEARILNPLPLGAGLNTGAQPRPALQPMAQSSYRSGGIPRAPMDGGLTPMVGGEPAPLPNVVLDRVAPTAPMVNYAEAVGFGRELPLALALSQVIPSEFSHSFAEGVDAGTSVSWEGGKPWDVVLKEMLRPVGMTATINGAQVTIQPLARG